MDPYLDSIGALDPDKERQKMPKKKDYEKIEGLDVLSEKILEASHEA
jgi:hypothetical protein